MNILLNVPLLLVLSVLVLLGVIFGLFGISTIHASFSKERVIRERVFFVITGIVLTLLGLLFCWGALYFWQQDMIAFYFARALL